MRRYLLPQNGNFYKANLHSHTILSDGSATPEQVKEVYRSMGYSIVAYTDHEVLLDQTYLSDENFLALNGVELGVNGKNTPDWGNMETCHIGLIALEPDNLRMIYWKNGEYTYAHAVEHKAKVQFYEEEQELERVYSGECISRIMKRGRDCGFFVVYNHPTGSLEDYSHYIGYHHMHAMEMYNGRDEYNPRVYDDMLRAGKRIYCVGGDDNHNRPQPTSGCGYSWTMIKADRLEYRAIARALINGDFYASQGPEIHELWFDEGTLHVSCSEVEKIEFITSNRRSRRIHAVPGASLCEAEYQVNPDSIYVRVVVTDHQGKSACTNACYLNETDTEKSQKSNKKVK